MAAKINQRNQSLDDNLSVGFAVTACQPILHMRRLRLIFILIFTVCSHSYLTAQMVFLDQGLQRTKEELATYRVQLKAQPNGSYFGQVLTSNNTPIMTGYFISWGESYLEDGTFTFFFPNGKTESLGQYDRGVRSGIWKRYLEDGTQKPDRFYPPEGAATLRKTLGIDKG